MIEDLQGGSQFSAMVPGVPKEEAVTLKSVAQRAGVSTSTASRYLRGQLNVQPETAARINEAVAAIGYRAANTRPERGPGSIAMIVPELTNPFFASLVETCADIAAARHLPLVISVSGKSGEREEMVSELFANSQDVDGIIYLGMNRSNAVLEQAVDDGLPVVVIDEEIDLQIPVDTVTVDNYGGAYQATSYLIHQGHARIAHVAGPPELSTTQERLRGYLDALSDAGLPSGADLVRHGPYTEQFGASVLPHLVRPGSDFTAIFVGSDIVAVGILATAELHGIRIPEDLSIVGCDGVRIGQWLRPKLTTLEQPIRALAQSALDTITQRIAERAGRTGVAGDSAATQTPSKTVLPLQLVIRGSVAPRSAHM